MQTMRQKNVQLRGHVLIELLVVLSILVLLAGMLFPSSRHMFDRSAFETRLRNTRNLIQINRLASIEHGNTKVCLIEGHPIWFFPNGSFTSGVIRVDSENHIGLICLRGMMGRCLYKIQQKQQIQEHQN